MDLEGIDSLGLGALDRDVLVAVAVKWAGRPIGLAPITAFVGEDVTTADEFLVRIGRRTRISG